MTRGSSTKRELLSCRRVVLRFFTTRKRAFSRAAAAAAAALCLFALSSPAAAQPPVIAEEIPPPTAVIEGLQADIRRLEKEIEALKGKLAAKDSGDLMGRVRQINGVAVLATVVEASDVKTLRDLGDKLRDRLRSGIILLGSRADGKAMLLCLVTKDLNDRYHAGKIIQAIAPLVGGSGGGRPDMAQAGGPKPDLLEQALEKLPDLL